MELTQQEHVDLNNAYKGLETVKSEILDRTFEDRYKQAETLRQYQSIAVANYFNRKKANIDILNIKGYVGQYYESPRCGISTALG